MPQIMCGCIGVLMHVQFSEKALRKKKKALLSFDRKTILVFKAVVLRNSVKLLKLKNKKKSCIYC